MTGPDSPELHINPGETPEPDEAQQATAGVTHLGSQVDGTSPIVQTSAAVSYEDPALNGSRPGAPGSAEDAPQRPEELRLPKKPDRPLRVGRVAVAGVEDHDTASVTSDSTQHSGVATTRIEGDDITPEQTDGSHSVPPVGRDGTGDHPAQTPETGDDPEQDPEAADTPDGPDEPHNPGGPPGESGTENGESGRSGLRAAAIAEAKRMLTEAYGDLSDIRYQGDAPWAFNATLRDLAVLAAQDGDMETVQQCIDILEQPQPQEGRIAALTGAYYAAAELGDESAQQMLRGFLGVERNITSESSLGNDDIPSTIEDDYMMLIAAVRAARDLGQDADALIEEYGAREPDKWRLHFENQKRLVTQGVEGARAALDQTIDQFLQMNDQPYLVFDLARSVADVCSSPEQRVQVIAHFADQMYEVHHERTINYAPSSQLQEDLDALVVTAERLLDDPRPDDAEWLEPLNRLNNEIIREWNELKVLEGDDDNLSINGSAIVWQARMQSCSGYSPMAIANRVHGIGYDPDDQETAVALQDVALQAAAIQLALRHTRDGAVAAQTVIAQHHDSPVETYIECWKAVGNSSEQLASLRPLLIFSRYSDLGFFYDINQQLQAAPDAVDVGRLSWAAVQMSTRFSREEDDSNIGVAGTNIYRSQLNSVLTRIRQVDPTAVPEVAKAVLENMVVARQPYSLPHMRESIYEQVLLSKQGQAGCDVIQETMVQGDGGVLEKAGYLAELALRLGRPDPQPPELN